MTYTRTTWVNDRTTTLNRRHTFHALLHSVYGVGTPKMPGEPARVQPSRMTQETREMEGLA